MLCLIRTLLRIGGFSSIKTIRIRGVRNLWFWAKRAGKQDYSCTGNFVISKCGFNLNQNKTPRSFQIPLEMEILRILTWKCWSRVFLIPSSCPRPAGRKQLSCQLAVAPRPASLRTWEDSRGHQWCHLPGSPSNISGLWALLWEPSSHQDFLGIAQLGPGMQLVRAAGRAGGWRAFLG